VFIIKTPPFTHHLPHCAYQLIRSFIQNLYATNFDLLPFILIYYDNTSVELIFKGNSESWSFELR